MICDWKETTWGMHHEISRRHVTAGNKRGHAGEHAKRDHKPSDKLDPAGDLQDRFFRSGHSAKNSENELSAVRGKHQTDDQSHRAINRIGKTAGRIHPGTKMSIVAKRLLPTRPCL